MAIPLQFDLAFSFNNGLAKVRKDNRWIVIDTKGNTIFNTEIERVISENLALKMQKFYEIINHKGEPIFQLACDYFSGFYDGIAWFKKDNKYGFINQKGEIKIEPCFDECIYYYGAYRTKKNGKIQYYDNQLNPIKLPIVRKSKSINNNYIITKLNDKYGVVKENRDNVIPFIYDYIFPSSNNNFIVKLDNKYGIVDENGEIIISPRFDELYIGWGDLNSDGVIRIKLNGKYGLISNTGDPIVECIFDNIGVFSEGFASFIQSFQSSVVKGYIKVYKNLKDYISFNLKEICSKSEYISPRVECEINKWSKRGEFETTKNWEERITNNREKRIVELIAKYSDEYHSIEKKNNFLKKSLRLQYFELIKKQIMKHFIPENLRISKYDADNETFLITIENDYGEIVLPVPLEIAPSFKENWDTIRNTINLEFIEIADEIELKSVIFHYGTTTIVYDSSLELEYNS